MRAEVTLLGRVIFGVYKDRVVRTGGHARFAPNADRLVEIDNAIRPFEHCRGRTSYNTGSMSTLITASDLMRSPHLRKHADIDVLDVRARYRQGNEVLRFARGRTRVAANAARVVNNLRPLDGAFLDHPEYVVDCRF